MRFFDPEALTQVKRGKLPHWTQPDVTYFVTFRLADSLPATKVSALREERDVWRLGESIVMPNHVHALVTPVESWTLASILRSWKSYSARQINKVSKSKWEYLGSRKL